MSQRSKKTWIISGLLALTIGSIGTYEAFKNEVVLKVDNKEQHINTFSTNVEDLLKEKNIKLEKDDKVLPNLKSKLKDDMKVTVKRAFKVNLVLDGQKREVITTENNVKNILKENDIQLSSLDEVIPSLNQKVKSNDEIKIIRVHEKVVTQKQEIPFMVDTVYDNTLEIGKSQKSQQGVAGQKEITYKIVFNDGKEIARNIITEKVISQPKNEIVKKGVKDFIVTSRGEVRRFKNTMQVVATAYTAGYESTGKRPGDRGYGKTCLGTTVRTGVIAVDPNIIPLGTKLYIESLDLIAIAEDTGGAIKGNKIDIYIPELSRAQKFGKRNLKVYVLE